MRITLIPKVWRRLTEGSLLLEPILRKQVIPCGIPCSRELDALTAISHVPGDVSYLCRIHCQIGVL